MTSGEKVAALDNLENLYSSSVSYIDAITHSASYYTDAQAAARYFPVGVKTDGSIAATWDGLTADQALAAMGGASGVIAIWSGSQASIPSGWVLCNGGSGTPNLRDRFIISTGYYAKGATGGSLSQIPTGTVTITTHALTVDEIPSHNHSYTEYYKATAQGSDGTSGTVSTEHSGFSTDAASSSAHGHSGSSFSGNSCDITPPFYALCYIMKS